MTTSQSRMEDLIDKSELKATKILISSIVLKNLEKYIPLKIFLQNLSCLIRPSPKVTIRRF